MDDNPAWSLAKQSIVTCSVKTSRVSQKAALNTSLICLCVNLCLLKNVTKKLWQKIVRKKKKLFHILSFWVFLQFWYCHNLSFWVCHNLSFWVWSQIQILGFVPVWFFKFCHNMSFWALSQFEFWGLFKIWFLSYVKFEFFSFVTIWVFEFCYKMSL